MRGYCGHTAVSRAAVSEYYGVSSLQAKGVPIRALYGHAGPPKDFATSRVMPTAEWISEDAKRATGMICAYLPGLLGHFARASRTGPRSTAFLHTLPQ